MTYIVQLFTGAAGSVAFGIMFHMKKKHLPLAALGGFLGWLLFINCRGFWGGANGLNASKMIAANYNYEL